MQAKTQGDLVVQDQGYEEKEITAKIGMPGIDELHTKSTEDIANALAIVLRSQGPGVTKLTWTIGKFIEVTTLKR